MMSFVVALACLVPALLLGGLLSGVDRRLTARMQSRMGPPLLQPFYDVLKLWGKSSCVSHPWLVFSAYMYLVSSALTVLILFMGGDLLLIFFVFTVGAVFQVCGALAVNSPYSQVGAQRELLQMLAYEPILILVFIGIFLGSDDFLVASIFKQDSPLLLKMPLLYVALGYALTIKLRKSPFDISASHHGHQELVKGVLTEYAGRELAMLEVGHWLDVIFMMGLCALFWHTSIMGMALLLIVTYAAEVLIDNISARMTWQWMLKNALYVCLTMCMVNILWLYARNAL